jgi:ABC-2 type transport system permease protein
MNIFLIVRHTRADEERGRTEVIRSLPVGRAATLAAAMLTAFIANTLLAALTGISMAIMGVEGFTFGSCMLYGVLLGVFGLFCAAVTAIFSQLCVSTRGALAFPGIIMVAGYMLRAVGDTPNKDGEMSSEILSYFSPMGLLQRTRVFADGETLFPVFIVLLLTAILSAAAFALNRVRDMGEGFIPARPGRRDAKKSLLRSGGLQMKLLRNTMIWWTAALFITAALYGSILADIGGFIEGNDFYGELMIDLPPELAQVQEKSFVATINIILMLCCAFPVLIAIFKIRSEEKDGRLENILAGAVSRKHILFGYAVIAFIASIAIPAITSIGFYLVSASVMEDPLPYSFFTNNALVYIPALWVILGIAVVIAGWFPKAAVAAWGYVVYSIFVMFFGRILGLPEWVVKTTPFGHVPMLILPDDDIKLGTMLILTLIAAVLTVVGFKGYSQRDMVSE